MLEIFTAHWDFWINGIAALSGIVGVIWGIIASRQSTSRKIIGYRVISNASIVDFHKDLDQEIEVILKPKIVVNENPSSTDVNGSVSGRITSSLTATNNATMQNNLLPTVPPGSVLQGKQPRTGEETIINNARLLIIEIKNLGNTVIRKSDLSLSRFRFEKGKVLFCGVQNQYVYPKDALHRISNGLQIDKDKESVEFIPEYLNKGDRANIKIMISENIMIKPEFDIEDGEAREIKPDQAQFTRRTLLIGSGGLLGGLLVAGAIKPISTFAQGQCSLGSIIIGGSSAFTPTANEAITEYRNICAVGPIVADIHSVTADSTQGINDLLGGQIQIAFSEIPRQDAEGIAAKKNQQIEANPVGLVVFALIVNQDAGIHDLTIQNIQGIYMGNFTNWSHFGGADKAIQLLNRNSNSGTRRAFERFVLNQPTSGNIPTVSSTDDMYNTITKTPGAIGYVDLKTAQENSSSGNTIILTITGKEASTPNAAAGQYSFCAMEYLYTLQNPGSLVTSFSKQVQAKIAEDTLYYIAYNKLSPTLQEKYQ